MKTVVLLIGIMLSNAVLASDSMLPIDHTPNSDIRIDYADLDYVLSSSVLDMGPSTHERAGMIRKDSGTRIYGGSRKPSRFEGNRVLFHLFRKDHKKVLRAIRDDILALPAKLSLSDLSRDHQLAYWLNLHNAIVLVKIAEEYPVTNLEPFFDREKPGAFISSEPFTFDGKEIMLADIQDHVVSNWRDPLVIYGFYLGAVGTPNLRQEAFHGERVYAQLRENALDFVNSVRGTQIWNGSELRVSSYYKRMAVMFPNFDTDVMRHIEQYARPSFGVRLVAVNEVTPRIDDWNIADLVNGHVAVAGMTGPRTIMGIDGTVLNQNHMPIQAIHALRGRANNFRRFKPNVELEELSRGRVETKTDADKVAFEKEEADGDAPQEDKPAK